MKKTISIVIILILNMSMIFSQSLGDKELSELKASFKGSSSDKAIQNALSNNKIKALAYNRQKGDKGDNYYSIEIETGSITNQEKSGRCWMFTSLNILRPIVMKRLNISDFEFSENYLYFWDILEKSNIFLERVIGTYKKGIYDREVSELFSSPVGDGGAWNSFVNLVKKYGLVPKEVMPETEQSENTSEMLGLINERLRKDGLVLREMMQKGKKGEVENEKLGMLKEIYRILALSLGEPPKEFKWRYKDKSGKLSEYKDYSPRSFWEEAVGVNLDDYVMFVDDPTRPYYKLYEKERDKNVYEGMNWTYINIPAKDLEKYAIKSLKGGDMMYFSCDVGKYLSKESGSLDINNYDYKDLYGINFDMNKSERMETHQSGSTHGMALCGVDIDKSGRVRKWKLENSWGAKYGRDGYLSMTEEWYRAYMFRLVINKKYLDAKVLSILKEEAKEVPYYNPAFSMDR
jgi:bleomycin hydrolase